MRETDFIIILLFSITAANVALYVTMPEDVDDGSCGISEFQQEAAAFHEWVAFQYGK